MTLDGESTPAVAELRAGSRGRPRFLDTATPSLSWTVETDASGWFQDSATIEVRHRGEVAVYRLGTGRSQHVEWPHPALDPFDAAEVRVSVTGADGIASRASAWVRVETGALTPSDWRAPFIGMGGTARERETLRFRTAVAPRSELTRALLSATAHGVYQLTIDGTVVGDEVLAPGWTSYQRRLTFQTHDVTHLIAPGGRHVLGAMVAEGWFGERYGFAGQAERRYPGDMAFSAQLRLEYADGTVEWTVTDETWEVSRVAPIVSAGIYPGECYDSRLEDQAMTSAAAELPGRTRPVLVHTDRGVLEPASAPPVRRIERVAATQVITTATGKTVLDFGQNLVGWVEFTVDAPEGHTITLRHAEVLEHGELATRPLRLAAATDSYVGSGRGRITWEPRFTFHGFRYVEVDGWPEQLDPADLVAVVVHSDLERTGRFECSDPRLNRLHENVVWGMRGNFLSIPTDCPQRDERLGWTGDIQVFASTASFLYDVSGFLGSWLRDLGLDQSAAGGVVPFVVPNVLGATPPATAAWGDAATLVPEVLYERYGDETELARSLESMRAWVDTVDGLAGPDRLWTGGFQFGDWLDPSAPADDPGAAKTDPDIVATAYLHRSATAVARALRIVGREQDAERYAALADAVRVAFVREYVTPAGRMLSDSHTAYALAIEFGLLRDPDLVAAAGARLAELVRSHAYRVGTGFVGTPLICDALCTAGQQQAAFGLLLEEGLPSWLYPVSMGATTIWERWDSMLPDGSINPGEMTSFNHYALGAVADWMQRSIGGLAPAAPGYRVVEIRPRIGGGLTSATSSIISGYGRISVSWSITDGRLELRVSLPPGTSGIVTLPGAHSPLEIAWGEHEWALDAAAVAPGVQRHPLSLDTPLGEIVDDLEARTAIESLFRTVDYEPGLRWTTTGAWKSGSRLGGSLRQFPPDAMARLEGVLTELNARAH